MCDIFENRNISYCIRSHTDFMRACVNTTNLRINSFKYLVTKVCDVVPYKIKLIENL